MIDANTDSDRHARLVDFIRKTVQERWEKNGEPLYLSVLGNQIRDENPQLLDLIGGSLQRFIESWHIAQIVRHPTQNQKIGAVPNGIQLPADIKQIFKPSSSNARHAKPRLTPEFWRAFYMPIRGRRFVILNDRESIDVIQTAQDPPDVANAYEILLSDIVDQSVASGPLLQKVAATWEKVDPWLQRNQLDVAQFLDRRGDIQFGKTIGIGKISPTLALALAGLDAADQSRIFIPLDIVNRMMSQK